jgi:hypothetical protein
VLDRSLPAPAYVQLDVRKRQVVIQPQHRGGLAVELANLLMWAHTLDEVTAQWWRTTADRLHVTVYGRTGGGLRLKIYTGSPFDETAGLVRLEPDQSEGVSLDELYALVGLLREAQPREVA